MQFAMALNLLYLALKRGVTLQNVTSNPRPAAACKAHATSKWSKQQTKKCSIASHGRRLSITHDLSAAG
jgi:hypothetical protein